MAAPDRGIVLFGDVVGSREDPAASTAWLRSLVAELEEAYPAGERLARFGVTQGDEIQALLRPAADPFAAILRASLHPERRPMRWAITVGAIDPGRGPATERTGEAFLAARDLLAEAVTRRDHLLVATGDPASDALLADLTPLLAGLLDELTDRQAVVGRLMLVEGLRGSEVAARLDVRRATVSVIADRGRIREIGRLVRALVRIVRTGIGEAA